MSLTQYDVDKPWTIQPFDTEETYALFREFLFMPPPRHLKELARRQGMTRWTVDELARKACWVDRAAAYDTWSAEQMAQVDADIRHSLTSFARSIRLASESIATEAFARTMSPKDAIRLFDSITKYHRLIGGQSTERVETVGNGQVQDLSNWSAEDLRALKALQSKPR